MNILTSIRSWIIPNITIPTLVISDLVFVSTGLA